MALGPEARQVLAKALKTNAQVFGGDFLDPQSMTLGELDRDCTPSDQLEVSLALFAEVSAGSGSTEALSLFEAVRKAAREWLSCPRRTALIDLRKAGSDLVCELSDCWDVRLPLYGAAHACFHELATGVSGAFRRVMDVWRLLQLKLGEPKDLSRAQKGLWQLSTAPAAASVSTNDSSLERRWRDARDTDTLSRWLRQLSDSGSLSASSLRLAAACGQPAAVNALASPVSLALPSGWAASGDASRLEILDPLAPLRSLVDRGFLDLSWLSASGVLRTSIERSDSELVVLLASLWEFGSRARLFRAGDVLMGLALRFCRECADSGLLCVADSLGFGSVGSPRHGGLADWTRLPDSRPLNCIRLLELLALEPDLVACSQILAIAYSELHADGRVPPSLLSGALRSGLAASALDLTIDEAQANWISPAVSVPLASIGVVGA